MRLVWLSVIVNHSSKLLSSSFLQNNLWGVKEGQGGCFLWFFVSASSLQTGKFLTNRHISLFRLCVICPSPTHVRFPQNICGDNTVYSTVAIPTHHTKKWTNGSSMRNYLYYRWQDAQSVRMQENITGKRIAATKALTWWILTETRVCQHSNTYTSRALVPLVAPCFFGCFETPSLMAIANTHHPNAPPNIQNSQFLFEPPNNLLIIHLFLDG